MDRRIILALVVVSVCLLSVGMFTFQPVTAQSTAGAIIDPDGSITGTNSIQRNGDVYTLTGNISGGLQIQKTGVTIDGAGFALIGNGTGRGIDLSINSGDIDFLKSIDNITVRNLIVTDFTYGVYIGNSGKNIFYSITIVNCEAGFWISGASNNDIIYNNIEDNIDGVSMNYATGNNMISRNNMINSGINVWQSTQPSVDKNYWNDYLTKYPDAAEIGNSGVGDTPYSFGDALSNFTDSHPLMQPISTSGIEFPTVTPSPTLTVVPTSTPYIPGQLPIGAPLDQVIIGYLMAGVAFAIVGFLLALMLKLRKRSKK